jgi:tetratricopeptide (TPR) repeat protein/serine/threonine protein kinase
MTARERGDNQRLPTRVPSVEVDRQLRYAKLRKDELLGRGGAGEVYRATLTDGEATVALKEPRLEGSGSEPVHERFQSGAEAWAHLDSHDHIVTVVDHGSEPTPWLALEYMDGGTLAERSPDSVAEAIWIAKCLASALQYAHKHGIAHLDLKPENVLFRETNGDTWPVPKISDWGLARVLLDGSDHSTPVTPAYAAPEHRDPETYGQPDEATDVYQLGLVFYEVLTGERPSSVLSTDTADGTGPVSNSLPPEFDRGLRSRIDAVLQRALAAERSERYETMVDFRRDLERLLTLVTGAESDDSIGTEPQGRGPALAADRHAEGTHGADIGAHGFSELSDEYFAERTPESPLRAWQTGFSLADVHAGFAAERTVERDGERVRLRDHLVDQLRDGHDVALLGQSACGKSTVCKAVACAWYERGVGPVLYREAEQTVRFDRPDSVRRVAASRDRHTLVVVEDAVRPAARAVFELMWSVDERSDVTVLVDSQTNDWHDPEGLQLSAKLDAYRQEAFETVHLPQPDRRECERIVQQFETVTDTRIDADADELVANVRAETTTDRELPDPKQATRPGNLLLLIHRLVMHAIPHETGQSSPTTRLKESVKRVYGELQAAGETQVDVGVLANVLNAAGIGVAPELLYATALDGQAATRNVEDALDRLDGHLLFRDRQSASAISLGYPTVHEAWSVAFLAHALEREGPDLAHERFARGLNAAFVAVTDVESRDRIRWMRHGQTPLFDTLGEEPTEWVEWTVEEIFRTGRRWPKIAPLFGHAEYSRLELPSGCSATTNFRCLQLRGEMYLEGGWYDRAEEAFRRLRERANQSVLETEADQDRWTARGVRGLARAAWPRGEFETACEFLNRALELNRALGDDEGIARCLKDLGIVARKQGQYCQAEAYQQRSLELLGEQDETIARARRLNELGAIAWSRGEYDIAEERYGESLSIRQTRGDRTGVAKCLTNLGVIDLRRGNYDDAERRFRRSLATDRELGNGEGETKSITNLAIVETRRGNLSKAIEYYEEALKRNRNRGSTRSEALCLNNLGVTAEEFGDVPTAMEYYQESLQLYREINDTSGEALALRNLGEVQHKRGDFETAQQRLETSLALHREIEDSSGEAACLHHLGVVARKRGEYDRAETCQERALETAKETGDVEREGHVLASLGTLAIDRGAYDAAAEHFSQSLSLRAESGETSGVADCHYRMGRLATCQGRFEGATAHLSRAESLADETSNQLLKAHISRQRGHIARQEGTTTVARDHYEDAIRRYREVDAVADELDTIGEYVDTCVELGEYERARSRCDAGLHLARQSEFSEMEATLGRKREAIRTRLDDG